MMNHIWAGMMLLSLVYGIFSGQASKVSESLLAGGGQAVGLIIEMAGGLALWCGLIEILRQAGVMDALGRLMKPLLQKLFPSIRKEETLSAITLNLAANMLGLGNAATPMGLKAMELMADEQGRNETASYAMCMFLVINSSSVQLFPSNVVTLRAAAGSIVPAGMLVPTLISTFISTLVGIILCLLMQKRRSKA